MEPDMKDIVFMTVHCRKHINFCMHKIKKSRIGPYAEVYYINESDYKEFTNNKISLKKRKKTFTEDTSYYVEDIRKDVVEKLGFDKVYKQGLNISTPINLDLQKIAIKSLREGLISYDKRRGWRGPIINSKRLDNWNNNINLDKFRLEKSINWEIAIVIKIDKFFVDVETENKENGIIKYENISWVKKEFDQILKVGDIIYVEKLKGNTFALRQLPEVNGGIVVMDPFTGRVLALSGGFSFKKSEFNRATQALRQPGSAFKPFIYALALENGYTPSTLILDAPLVLEQGSDLKMWKPENYGKKFYGPSTLRMGLEKSRNLMTVRIAQDLGLKKIVNFSKQLRIYEDPSELLSISLGSAETTLLKLTSAYSSFVNGGKLIMPIMIDRIQDSEGNTIFNNEKRKCINCDQISYLSENYPNIRDEFLQIFSSETAYQMTSILEGTVQNGTGKNLKDLNLDIGGKTGTTNSNTDTWFIGFTSKLVIGAYVGFDNPKSLGKYETGAKTALPIFKNFVKNAVKKEEARPFKVADNIIMKVIDPITGKKPSSSTKSTIIEAYKNLPDDNLANQDINNRLKNNNILRFY